MKNSSLILAIAWFCLTIVGIVGWCLGWNTPSWLTYIVMTLNLGFMNWSDWYENR